MSSCLCSDRMHQATNWYADDTPMLTLHKGGAATQQISLPSKARPHAPVVLHVTRTVSLGHATDSRHPTIRYVRIARVRVRIRA